MKKALVIGSLNMDMTVKVDNLPKLGETIFGFDFYKSFGGKGGNQAVAISKLGLKTEMLAMVGNDEDGLSLIKNLESRNIKSSVIISNEITGRAIITVDKNGNNHIIVIPGANFKISKKDIDDKIDVISNTDIVIFQNEIPINITEYALKIAKKLNKITLFNPAPAEKFSKEIYSYVDYLIVNETELEYIFDVNYMDKEKILKIKKEMNLKNLLVTLGEKGSMIFTEKDEIKEFKAYKVKAIDTTAAGDSFIGAFAAKITLGSTIDEAINYATAVSALVVTKIGAQDSIPNEDEIIKFINNNKI